MVFIIYSSLYMNFIANFLKNKLEEKFTRTNDNLWKTLDKWKNIISKQEKNVLTENQKKDSNIGKFKVENNDFRKYWSVSNKTESIVYDSNLKEKIKQQNSKLELKSEQKWENILRYTKERKKNIINNNKNIYNQNIKDITKWTEKKLSWYLWNNTNLDNTIKNMNINEMEKDLDNGTKAFKAIRKNWKKNFKIEKPKPYKNLFWIFTQFLIWIIFIIISAIHINSNVAEYKFIKSSIDLWTNTFNSIVSKFGWVVWENAKDTYIEKRKNLLSSLIIMQDKLDNCDKEWKEEIGIKLLNLKAKLMDTHYLTLQEFIDNYDQYKIAVNSIRESIDSLCNN